jgi:hypothetical protein
MKKNLHHLSLCLVFCCSATATAQSLVEQLGDASTWKSFDWSAPSASAIWQDHNWVDYLGKQSATENRQKIQAFLLDRVEWQAILETRQDGNAQPWQLTIYTPAVDTQTDHCDSLYAWASHHFGQPRIAVDGSYRIPATAGVPEHSYTDRHYQWDIGTTRVTQACIGQSSLKEGEETHPYAVSTLRFTAHEATGEVHPLINAHCTRSLRLSDSSDIPLKMSDITFIIDANNGSIRRPDLVPIRVRNVAVASDQVRFSIAIDKSTNDYRIDLPSGQLSATMLVSGIRAGEVSGQCDMSAVLTAPPPTH